jgi:O-antigen ligase
VLVCLLPRYVTVKNMLLPVLGAVAAAAVLATAMDTLMSRFDADTEADLEYRGLYNAQARLMVGDKPFGVGMGNFSAYSWTRYAERVDPDLHPGTPPHNIVYLTLGELGYPGLLAFALIWIRFYWLGIPLLIRMRRGLPAALAAGAVTATLVNHVQNFLHMTYRETPMYFMMRISMGLAVAAHLRFREEERAGGEESAPEEDREESNGEAG